jgi:hypothetical protein
MIGCAGLAVIGALGLAALSRRAKGPRASHRSAVGSARPAAATVTAAAATAVPASPRSRTLVGPVAAGGARRLEREAAATKNAAAKDAATKENWRMPRLAMLAPVQMSLGRRIGMLGMWVYLVIAMAAVVYRIAVLALGH